ncbi:MAG TPA: ferrochelatase, partial [Rhizomicrobium sp.]|nr:ferrochelatase [Rhizomicrobium sp.]
MKLGIVLFNLGGPDRSEAIKPFLRNLFSDPAIIRLPAPLRLPLARFIASRRAPIAHEIYAKIGGRSPILEETEAQGRALEQSLTARGHEVKSFIAMRYTKPFAEDAARDLRAWKPDRTVLLPLYPQFSTTSSGSSLTAWRKANPGAHESRVCCYPGSEGFIDTQAALVREAFAKTRPNTQYRLLLSAHGLPKRIAERGDPYQWQVEQTATAIVERLEMENLDWRVCYQSRVGRLAWLEPATDAEIKRAGAEGKGIIIAPIAFVSEHSETLVELDIEYAKLARESGVPDYLRVPTVGIQSEFIGALADLVERAARSNAPVTCGAG